MRHIFSAAAIAALAVVGTAAAAIPASSTTITPNKPMKGSALASKASISLATARSSALKARPGVVTDEELETEKGGSGLRYSFDITSGGKPFEVGIDAKTGAVLENTAEGRNAD